MDPKIPKLPTYCTMDNAEPDWANFWIAFAVVILQRPKVVRCVQFYWTRGYFSKKKDACNKTLCLALEYIENCWFRVLFVIFGCLDGQIWVQQNLAAHKRLLIQGICAPPFVAIVRCDWAMRLLGIWSADHTPFLYPVTLIAQSILLGVSPL